MRQLPTGTVTLLFSDIEGSTYLLQQLGEHYNELLNHCREVLHTAFHQYHGHEVDTQGDGFFVAFARASDAVSAAVEAQRALAAHAWSEGVTLRVRMGLHTGEPQLVAEDYVGLDVHRAARIMSAGHGGQVLLSQTTRDLVEYDLPIGVSLRDLGAHRLKDLQHPSRLFQLVIAGLPADFPPLKTLDTRPHNLSVQPTPLIGRELEVGVVCELMRHDEVRLVTLTGPGGIGKTRLGLQVAADFVDSFADGVFFVDLASISDPELVMPAIAQILGISAMAGWSWLKRLEEMLWQRQMLLLLDNFEQVVSAAVQVADLLAACPQLKVLVTSREVLHVKAEHEFVVQPLTLPDTARLPDLAMLPHYTAVALFLQRAQAAKPDFQLTVANAQAIVDICVHLEGLPLAIELAAARIKLLPPQALLKRLSPRLAVLTGVTRDVPARQQTMRNTIAWSYHLLNVAEQRLFRCLSVFVGGCTLEAAEAVCAAGGNVSAGIGGSVLDGVASLIDKSLLQQTEQEGEELRLLMLETIREYGQECLFMTGGARVIQRAHAAYYMALAEEGEPGLTSTGKRRWLKRLQREHENLRMALEWLLEQEEKEKALRLGSALWRFWWVCGRLSEGRDLLERVLAASEEDAAAPVRVKALYAAGALAGLQGDFDQAETLCGESLELFQALGDARGMATSLWMLGYVAMEQGNYAIARIRGEQSVALFREIGDQDGLVWSLFNLGSGFLFQGEYGRARSLLEEAVALSREAGNTWSLTISLWILAQVLFYQCDPTGARILLEESLALSRQEGYKTGIAYSLHLMGQVACLQGDAATARSLLEESLALLKELGDRLRIAQAVASLAWVSLLERDYAAARVLIEESLAISRVVGDKRHLVMCLVGLEAVAAALGELVWAARLEGAMEALREAIGVVLHPTIRTIHEFTIAAIRDQLGEEAFTVAQAEGRRMTPEQALAAQGQATTPALIPAAQTSALAMKSATAYPDGLTPREVEVLRLVAQGLTDAQVAEQLVISPRTVNNHLTSLYRKIQVSTRSAATRYALEHRLI
jgi:predicted ATPase/class 3 adenylate cyclase/DNA-binding CsgD family transcriptional regulator